MLTCIIRYHIDPTRHDAFAQYARMWNSAIPRCGADLIGYFAPHEGSTTRAYGVYTVPNLAEYEAYKLRLSQDPIGREAFDFAQKERFIKREDRTWLRRVEGMVQS